MTSKQPMVSQLGGIVRIFAKSVKDASEHAEVTVGTHRNIKSKSTSLARCNHKANSLPLSEYSEDHCLKKSSSQLVAEKRHKTDISHTKHFQSRSLEKSKTKMLKVGNNEKSVESEADNLISKQDTENKNNLPTCSKNDETDKHHSSIGLYSSELNKTSMGYNAAEPKSKIEKITDKKEQVKIVDKKVNNLKNSFFGGEDWTSELLDQSVIENACSYKELAPADVGYSGTNKTKIGTPCDETNFDSKRNTIEKLSETESPLDEKSGDNWTSNPKDTGKKNMSHLNENDSLTDDSDDVLDTSVKIHADVYPNETCPHSKKHPNYGRFKLRCVCALQNQKVDIGGGGDTARDTQDFCQIHQDQVKKQMRKQCNELEVNPVIKSYTDDGIFNREVKSFIEIQNTENMQKMTDKVNSMPLSDCDYVDRRELAKDVYDNQRINIAINDAVTGQQSLGCRTGCKPRTVTRSRSILTSLLKNRTSKEQQEKQLTNCLIVTEQCSNDKYGDQTFHSSEDKEILEMKVTPSDTVTDSFNVEDVNSYIQEDEVVMPLSQEDWSDDLINTSIPIIDPSPLPDLDLEDYEAESQTDSAGNLFYSFETSSSVDQDFMPTVYSQEDDFDKMGTFPNPTQKADDFNASGKPKCIFGAHVNVDKDLEAMKNIAQQQLNQVYSVPRICDYEQELDSDYSDSELIYSEHKIEKSTFITSKNSDIVSDNLCPKEHHAESSSSDHIITSVNINQTPGAPDSINKSVSPKETFDIKSKSDAGNAYTLMQSSKENTRNSPLLPSQISRHRSDGYFIQPQNYSSENVCSTTFPRKHFSTAIYPDGISQNNSFSFAEPTKTHYVRPSYYYPDSHIKSHEKKTGSPVWSINRTKTSWEYKQYQKCLLSDMVLCIPLKDIHSRESQEKMFTYVKNVVQLISESQTSNVTKDSKVLLRTVFNGESYDLNVGVVGHRASFCPFSDSSVSSNFQNQHPASASQDQIFEVTMEHDILEPQRKIGRHEQPQQDFNADLKSRGSGLQNIVSCYSDDHFKSRHDGCGCNNQDKSSVQSRKQNSESQRESDNVDEPSATTLPSAETSQVNSDSLMKRIWSKILPGKHQCNVQTISGVKRSHVDHVDHADKSVGPSEGSASWIGNDLRSCAQEGKVDPEQNRCPDCASCLCCKHKHVVVPKKNSPRLEDLEERNWFHDVKDASPTSDLNSHEKQKGSSSLFNYRNPGYCGMPYPFWMAQTSPPYSESMVMYPRMPQWIYPYSYPYSPPKHLPGDSESASSSSFSSPHSPPKSNSAPASKSLNEKRSTENEALISSSPRSPISPMSSDTSIVQSSEHMRRKRFQRKFQETKNSYPSNYTSENTNSPVSKSSGCSPLVDRSLSGNNNLLSFDWKEKFKRKYGGYTIPFIDSHCHLDLLFDREGFQGTFSKYRFVHKETFPENFFGCVTVFCNPASFIPDGGLWKDLVMDYKSTIYLAMGCHPKNALNFDSVTYNNLKACLQHPRVVACGEIGLDYSGTFYQHKEQQMEVFSQQLKLALEVKKPIVIHCRDAEDDCLEIMEKIVPRNYTIHCHCFTGNYVSCQKWLNKFPKLFVGLTPVITYTTARPAQEVAKYIPLERLLLETDAPYFVPSTVPRSQQPVSHPGMAIAVAVQVAFLKDISVSMVLSHCFRNTKTMYGISCNA